MKLYNYSNEILDLAKKLGVSVSDAKDLFLNNIRDAGDPSDQYHYEGADGVDYAALKPHYDELLADGAAFSEAVKDLYVYAELTDLRNAGKRDEVVSLMRKAVESRRGV